MSSPIYEASVRFTTDTSGVTNGLSDVKNKLDSSTHSALSFGDILKANVIGQAIISGVKTLAGALGGIAKTGVQYNAQIEQSRVALTTLLGDEIEAKELMETIKKNASVTPFDVASLTTATQLLISADVEAGDATETIMALGDAVSATGGNADTLSRMANNLQGIKNVGKASAADLKQFQIAGINVTKMISEQTGKSIEQIEKQGVTYEMITEALKKASAEGGKYYNASEAQSHTFNGMLSTLKDNVTSLQGQIMGGLSSGLVDYMVQLNDGVVNMKTIYEEEGLAGMLNAGIEMIGSLIGGLLEKAPEFLQSGLDLLYSLLGTFEGKMPDFVKWAFDLVWNIGTTLLKNTPMLIGHAIAMLGSLLSGIIQKLYETGAYIVDGVWQGIKAKASEFYENVKGFFSGIVNSVKNVLGIHSPSRVFADIGKFMALGLEQGWEDEYGDVKKSIIDDMDFNSSASLNGTSKYGVNGGVSVVQNIYSQAKTRADLMEEALYNQRKAVLLNV